MVSPPSIPGLSELPWVEVEVVVEVVVEAVVEAEVEVPVWCNPPFWHFRNHCDAPSMQKGKLLFCHCFRDNIDPPNTVSCRRGTSRDRSHGTDPLVQEHSSPDSHRTDHTLLETPLQLAFLHPTCFFSSYS